MLLLLLSGGQGWICSASAEEAFLEVLQVRLVDPVEIPEFSLPSVSGGEVKLRDFQEKIVFLNFWATWCPYCRLERPALQALYDKYKDKDFVVVSVSIDRSDIKTVKKYVEEHEITFPNLHDQQSKLALEYGIRGVPSTFFINRDGKAIGGGVGPRAWDSKEAHDLVEHLLSKND